MNARGLRSRLGDALRRVRLLGAADRMLRHLAVAVEAPANRGFRREHPAFALPPAHLAFETLGHVSAREYHRSGMLHARMIAGLVREFGARADPDVLEWGCGCARILRNLRGAGIGAGRLAGCDVDAESVDWCRRSLPGIRFERNGLGPPLPFPDAEFDAVYHYSVLTHLARERAERWIEDIARVLRPDGIMIGTTHGERYGDMLLPTERERMSRGEVVARIGANEGRKRFLAFHPAATMRSMLAARFREVRQAPPSPEVPQDLWIARYPLR